MKLFGLLICASLLTGCVGTQSAFLTVPFISTQQLRTCLAAPKPPQGAITQKDVAIYLAKLKYAHRDCYNKLGALSDEVNMYNAILKSRSAKK